MTLSVSVQDSTKIIIHFTFPPFDDPSFQTDLQFSTQHVLADLTPFHYDSPATYPDIPETSEYKKAILSIVDLLVVFPDGQYFLRPVDVVLDNAPHYYDIIKSPIDLQKIQNKASHDQYTSFKEFMDDCKLLIDNALLYNADSDITASKTVYYAALNLSHYLSDLLSGLLKNPADIISKSKSDLADQKIGLAISQLQKMRKEHNRKSLKSTSILRHKTANSRSRIRFTEEELKQLIDNISHLHSHALIGVVEILAKKPFSQNLVSTPLAMDLRVLQEDQLEKLKVYVDNCLKEGKGDQYYFSWQSIIPESLEKIRNDYPDELMYWKDVPAEL